MGKLTRKEILMAGLAVLALTLWVFGHDVFNTSAVALGIVCLMIITGVVSWTRYFQIPRRGMCLSGLPHLLPWPTG